MVFLTAHFSLEEMTSSSTAMRRGLDNSPTPGDIENLRRLCEDVLEPLRAHLGTPVVINSGYRSHDVNKAVGGVQRSQHMFGEAADIEAPPLGNKRLAETILGLGLPFDQLLLEHIEGDDPSSGWVHVSHRATGDRKQYIVIPKPRARKD